MERGFVKLWRKITTSPVFVHSDHELLRVWIFLLTIATFKQEEAGEGILKGQVWTSREELQAKMFPTGGNMLSKKCCWGLLKTLEDLENIRIEECEGVSLVTITNWEVYQAPNSHSDRGFFKLWRKIVDSDVFAVPEVLKLWIYCLASASYDDVSIPPNVGSKSPVLLKKGQFIIGREKLRRDLFHRVHKGTPSAVTCWRWLKRLEDMKAISIQSSGSYSIVTINNWSAHQV
jgi:hypothetical protein